MKKILAVVVGLVVLGFSAWAVAGPNCCSKAKSTTSASAAGEKVEKASAACEPKETKTAEAAGAINTDASACVEKAVKLSIAGMHCGDCSKKIQAALSNLEGVCASKVSYTRKNAEVVYNANQLSEERIVQTVTTAGFTVASTKASNWKASKSEDCCKAKKAAKTTGSDT